LLIFGLFAGITSGAAFEATLKQKVQEWSKNRSTRTLAQMKGVQLVMPFIGIAAGICVFLAAGLEIFGFPSWLSYSVSLPLTLFIASLVWSQLSKLLSQLERGGSRSLDLDAMD
jgi:formate hydrogenlyase subunit 3/multisubunit Na+/H+ antiporter MnhD subunit